MVLASGFHTMKRKVSPPYLPIHHPHVVIVVVYRLDHPTILIHPQGVVPHALLHLPAHHLHIAGVGAGVGCAADIA